MAKEFLKILQKILKKLKPKTQSILSKNIQNYWVYKLTIEQVSLIFESSNYSFFGLFNRSKKLAKFIEEYNRLFNLNSGDKELNTDIFILKLGVKRMKLRAMYNALLFGPGANAKKEFAEMFGHEFTGLKDFKLIVDEGNRLQDKIKMLQPGTKQNDKSITFNQLVIMVETSRGLPIDRNIKLYEFKKMYDIELTKWRKT